MSDYGPATHKTIYEAAAPASATLSAIEESVTATSLATKHILYLALPTVLSHPQEQWTNNAQDSD